MPEYKRVRIFGDPVLKEKARPVESFDEALRELVSRMFSIMSGAGGIGLAAPQAGHLLRVITIDISPAIEGEGSCVPGPFVIVNPVVTWASEETEPFEEGCLSLPGVSVEIVRPSRVTVEYQDEYGHRHVLEADGLLARVLQHEIDHLNGVLIIDRAEKSERLRALDEFNQFLLAEGIESAS
jgi:peptide deformylase